MSDTNMKEIKFVHALRPPLYLLLFSLVALVVLITIESAWADQQVDAYQPPVSPSYFPGERTMKRKQNLNSLQATGSISGSVYESDGTTIVTADAFVNVFDPITETWIGGSKVNVDGTYTIANLPPGSYLVRAKGPTYAVEFYNEAGLNGFEATPISVTDNSHIGDIDFTLNPGGTISGVVYADDGITPLSNVNVAPVDVWIGTCTNANGEYILESVPLNTPLAVYSGSGNWCEGGANNFIREWWSEADSPAAATPITLTPESADVTGIDFALAPGSAISGVVFMDDGVTPLANLNVGIDGKPIGACTNAHGEYTLYGVPVDTPVTIYAGSTNWCFNGPSNFIREWWHEVDNPAVATTIILEIGEPDLAGIDFTLIQGGSISGVVYRSDGVTPLANLNVGIDDRPIGICTNANGEYTLSGIPIDTAVTVYSGSVNWCVNGSGNFYREWWQEVDNQPGATSIALTAEIPDITGIDFTLIERVQLYLPIILRQ